MVMNNESYQKELRKLVWVKRLLDVVPARVRHRLARKLYDYQSDAVQGIDLIAKTRHEIGCLINTKDLIGWNIFFFGQYEKNTNNTLEQYVKEGDVVIEAGANIGSETVLLSKYTGQTGMVHAFEPSPYVLERLQCNVMLNTVYKNVKMYGLAVGDENKDVTFYIFPKQYHNSGIGGKYANWENSTPITVKQVSLDNWAKEQGIQKVDLIKMDIQGAEMELLRGADEIISKYKPKIFLEAHENKEEIYKILKSKGYTIHVITDNGLVELKEVPSYASDWFAIHQ
jgi:FkbM family methyltransferase